MLKVLALKAPSPNRIFSTSHTVNAESGKSSGEEKVSSGKEKK